MERRLRFTTEFKCESIPLMKISRKLAAVLARELGVPRNRLYKWSQNAQKKGEKTTGSIQPDFVLEARQSIRPKPLVK